MISVVVEVPEPFDALNGRPPLLPGIFVEILIQGNTLGNAVAVPRDAIREGNQMWLVNSNRLEIRPLKIVRVDKNFAYVVSNDLDEANVIISSLDAVIDGMEVRMEADVATQDEQVKNKGDQPDKPEVN
jgi:multidrug efflux pump subunit AcrA (membrane-fusion protein)